MATKSGYEFTPVTVNLSDFVTPQTVNFHGVPQQTNNPPPSGNTFFSRKVNYAYKATGALSSLGTSIIGGDALSTTNVIESLSYRAFGAAQQIVYGNDRKTDLSYDASLMRLTQQITKRWNGSDTMMEQSYSYQENGLLSSIGNNGDRVKSCGNRFSALAYP